MCSSHAKHATTSKSRGALETTAKWLLIDVAVAAVLTCPSKNYAQNICLIFHRNNFLTGRELSIF